MKVDFSKAITDLGGRPMLVPDAAGDLTLPGEEGGLVSARAFTLRDVALVALHALLESDKRAVEIERITASIKRMKFAEKVYGTQTAIEIGPENLVMLRKRIGEHYADKSALVLLRAYELTGGTD